MKARNISAATILAMSLAWPCIAGAEGAKSVEQIRGIIENYRSSLDRILARVGDHLDNREPAFYVSVLKSSVVPYLGWGRIRTDGAIAALTNGYQKGCWAVVRDPESTELKSPGSTLSLITMASGDKVIAIRPDSISSDWAGVFITKELVHCYFIISGQANKGNEAPAAEDFIAYLTERSAVDVLTNGRFTKLLDEALEKEAIKSTAELVTKRLNVAVRPWSAFKELDDQLALSPPASEAEVEMRYGFYMVAAAIRMDEKAGLDDTTRTTRLSEFISSMSRF
jgi:hypothetical protein